MSDKQCIKKLEKRLKKLTRLLREVLARLPVRLMPWQEKIN